MLKTVTATYANRATITNVVDDLVNAVIPREKIYSAAAALIQQPKIQTLNGAPYWDLLLSNRGAGAEAICAVGPSRPLQPPVPPKPMKPMVFVRVAHRGWHDTRLTVGHLAFSSTKAGAFCNGLGSGFDTRAAPSHFSASRKAPSTCRGY